MHRNMLRLLNRKKTKAMYIRLNVILSLFLIILLSLALAYISIRVQITPIEDVWAIIVESGYMVFRLNWIPLLLVMLLLYALFNNTVIACGLTGGVVFLLSMINRNMIIIRQDPFKPLDILLGNEFMGIAGSIDTKLLIITAAAVIGFLGFFALCLFFIRNKRMHPAIRLIAAAVMAAVCVWYNNTTLSDADLYESLYVEGNRYNLTDNFESKGFIYSFLYTLNTSHLKAPPTYDKDKAVITELINTFTPSDLTGAAKPNIIMVLSEAFSDILLSPNLNFEGYTDPLVNYKLIRGDSISGSLIVPNIGGGTADTEFDILTGLNTRHLRGTPYTYDLIARPVSALPSVLSGIGYHCLALHPGYGWFYNRHNVFRYIGFDEFQDIEYYDRTKNKGVYISEKHTMERTISEYERHIQTSPDTPIFTFCIAIQNHGPYKDQYNASKNFNINVPLSDTAEKSLANYIEGVIDCDRELGVIVDFLNNRPEPVILVYFGDHIPSFTSELYNALLPSTAPIDSFETLTRLYRTPFLIWQNQPARDLLLLEESAIDNEWPVSTNFFGVNLLSMLGFNGLNPFMDYVSGLSGTYTVILENHALVNDGSFINLTETPSSQIDFYRSWEHYWIFNDF